MEVSQLTIPAFAIQAPQSVQPQSVAASGAVKEKKEAKEAKASSNATHPTQPEEMPKKVEQDIIKIRERHAQEQAASR
jgi:hypothetical protein